MSDRRFSPASAAERVQAEVLASCARGLSLDRLKGCGLCSFAYEPAHGRFDVGDPPRADDFLKFRDKVVRRLTRDEVVRRVAAQVEPILYRRGELSWWRLRVVGVASLPRDSSPRLQLRSALRVRSNELSVTSVTDVSGGLRASLGAAMRSLDPSHIPRRAPKKIEGGWRTVEGCLRKSELEPAARLVEELLPRERLVLVGFEVTSLRDFRINVGC